MGDNVSQEIRGNALRRSAKKRGLALYPNRAALQQLVLSVRLEYTIFQTRRIAHSYWTRARDTSKSPEFAGDSTSGRPTGMCKLGGGAVDVCAELGEREECKREREQQQGAIEQAARGREARASKKKERKK